jgi:hypothetical protein
MSGARSLQLLLLRLLLKRFTTGSRSERSRHPTWNGCPLARSVFVVWVLLKMQLAKSFGFLHEGLLFGWCQLAPTFA